MLFLIGVFLIPLFAGCTSAKAPTPPHAITLEFWTLQLNTFRPYIEGMIADYEATHPGIHIEWVDVPFNQGEKRALTAIVSRRPPDVMNLNPDFSGILANRDSLLNMNAWVPQAQKQQYLSVAWESATLTQQHSPSSPSNATPPQPLTFGLPWYLSSKITLYNRNLLRQAGWKTPPKTYPELAQLAQDLKTLKGQTPYAVMPALSEHGFFLKSLRQLGMPLFTPQGQIHLNTPQAVAHLNYWITRYQRRDIPAESMTEGHQAAVDRYQSGALALLLSGPNMLNLVKENAVAVYQATGTAPQFPESSPYVDFSTMVLVVPKDSPHPKEAVDFALFVTNAQNQLKLCQLAPVLPSRVDGLNTLITQPPPVQKSQTGEVPAIPSATVAGQKVSARQLLQAQRNAERLPETLAAIRVHPQQHAMNERVDYYVQGALLGHYTAEEALHRAEAEINLILEKGGPQP